MAWPWWLFLIPTVIVIALVVNDEYRTRVLDSFLKEEVGEHTAGTRARMTAGFALVFIISTIYCWIGTGLQDLQWRLLALVSLCALLRLYAMSCKTRKWPKLQQAVADNLFELTVICTLVLFVYTLALWRFHALPLDEMTLERLKSLQESVEKKHRWLEEHKLHFKALLVFLGTMIAVRIVARVWPVFSKTADVVSKSLVRGVMWSEWAGTALAVAASLTFLATQQTGPLLLPISLSLNDAQKDYDSFRADIRHSTEIALRQALIDKAWNTRPSELKSAMAKAAEFLKERQQLAYEQKEASDSFQIVSSRQEHFPAAADTSDADATVNGQTEDADLPSVSWTPSELHKAALEAKDLIVAREKEEEERRNTKVHESAFGKEAGEDASEMAKEALDDISPAEKLFQAPVIELLKTHFPVFGEFLDAISASITEGAFDSIRDAIVRRIARKRSGGYGTKLADVLSLEVKESAASMPVDLSRFDAKWQRANDATITSYRTEIVVVKVNLEQLASRKLLENTETLFKSAFAARDEIARVAKETGASSLLQKAKGMQQILLESLALAKSWPALTQPSSEQKLEMKRIYSEFASNGWDDIGPSAPFLWSSPLDAITTSQGLCHETLLHVVSGGGYNAAKLRAAMGSDYDLYRTEWHQRIEAVRRQQEETRRQREEQIRQERIQEQRREYEYRQEHPVEEHPVEIP